MTASELNEKLKKYRAIKTEIMGINEVINEIRSTYENKSVTLTGMPSSNQTGNPTETKVIKVIALIEHLEQQKAKLIEELHSIENIISSIDDEMDRSILRHRYMCDKEWEDVADAVGYSTDRVRHKAYEALNKLATISLE